MNGRDRSPFLVEIMNRHHYLIVVEHAPELVNAQPVRGQQLLSAGDRYLIAAGRLGRNDCASDSGLVLVKSGASHCGAPAH